MRIKCGKWRGKEHCVSHFTLWYVYHNFYYKTTNSFVADEERCRSQLWLNSPWLCHLHNGRTFSWSNYWQLGLHHAPLKGEVFYDWISGISREKKERSWMQWWSVSQEAHYSQWSHTIPAGRVCLVQATLLAPIQVSSLTASTA